MTTKSQLLTAIEEASQAAARQDPDLATKTEALRVAIRGVDPALFEEVFERRGVTVSDLLEVGMDVVRMARKVSRVIERWRSP